MKNRDDATTVAARSLSDRTLWLAAGFGITLKDRVLARCQSLNKAPACTATTSCTESQTYAVGDVYRSCKSPRMSSRRDDGSAYFAHASSHSGGSRLVTRSPNQH